MEYKQRLVKVVLLAHGADLDDYDVVALSEALLQDQQLLQCFVVSLTCPIDGGVMISALYMDIAVDARF